MAIITISRGTMSGGLKLAQMLCEKLNYHCISREIIVETAEKFGVPEYKLFAAIQKGPSLLQRLTFERERYLAYIQATLCELVKDDNIVYHGHAGHFLLPSISHVLKIRIVADMEFRIAAAMKQHNLSVTEAEKHIEEVDRSRIKWTKFLYGVDWRSPELYDITFNINHLDLELVSDIVVDTGRQPRFQTTPESTREIADLLLSSRVKTALAEIPYIRLDHLQIKADGGSVLVKGKVKSKQQSELVLKTIAEVAGVTSVNDEINIDYRYQGIDT